MSAQIPHPTPSAELPPLRIHHFLVWMAVVAASITYSRVMIQEPLYGGSIYRIVEEIIQSLALTIFGFGLIWLCHGLAFLSESGHGMVLLQSGYFLRGLIDTTLYGCFMVQDSAGWPEGFPEDSVILTIYYRWEWDVFMLGAAFLGVACALWIAQTQRWRVFYLTVSAIFVAIYLLRAVYLRDFADDPHLVHAWVTWLKEAIYYIPRIMIAAILIYLALADWRDCAGHHWSHWCGIAGPVLMIAAAVTYRVWIFLDRYNWYSLPPQVPVNTF